MPPTRQRNWLHTHVGGRDSCPCGRGYAVARISWPLVGGNMVGLVGCASPLTASERERAPLVGGRPACRRLPRLRFLPPLPLARRPGQFGVLGEEAAGQR